jgi:transcriptional regulator with PAS, ATPase and Fis domain
MRTKALFPLDQNHPRGEGVNLTEINKYHIKQAFQKSGGNKTRAAKLLGISRASLIYRLKKYQITQ